ncbi:CHAT domain-containing protein [Waterburya agarophytonicola K14]|uniref:CHAT domain-containing protein n=2 Tax=Waterburya TaxID=2886915 RepID=A0A964BTK3_9CYAN|nr:CHAT domain-containing protein [Waterburya agarophytonicola KI4]
MRRISSFKTNFILFNSIFGFLLIIAYLFLGLEVALAGNETKAIATNSSQNKLSISDRGRLAYQEGRYTEAKKIWQNAYKIEQLAQNIQSQAQILNYLALVEHQLGNNTTAEEYLTHSLELIPDPLQDLDWQIKAQALNTQGKLALEKGKAKSALTSWQEADLAYQQGGDKIGKLGVQINQTQAWQSLGLYRRAQKALENIAIALDRESDLTLKITGLRSLGIALQIAGDLEAAEELFEESLGLSKELNLDEESSTTLFSLGNNALALGNETQAIDYYQQATATTARPLLKTEARLNQLGLLIATEQWQAAQGLLPKIQTYLANFEDISSRRLVYARVNLAKHSIELSANTGNRNLLTHTQDLLLATIERADRLEDPQSKSYALGILGHLYESDRQINLGCRYTRKALQLAQTINNSELTYQWQWQLGRLLQNKGNHQGAVASYTGAVNALESLRSDLVVTNANLQFSFREQVEPVYRELVSLLLSPVDRQPVSQANLLQARNTIESLQLAELNNFFREACLDATPTAIDQIDRQAAVIYPIILRDRLEVIVSFPDKSLKHYTQPIAQSALEPIIEELRQTLQIRSRRKFYQPAQKLYSWLIAPVLQELEQQQVETLVFVPDGSFRNIPLATLHDGEKYLIQQYNVALTPGLQLLAPLPLEKVQLKTLAAGITQQRRGFSSLEYVNQELLNIQNQTDTFVLRDEKFTQQSLQTNIESSDYSIVHIATHGQFSSNLDDTFLLAWDSDIKISDLDQILSSRNSDRQRAIELLILSACETARGDKRAALGLAGIAVKAGAKTTLATLWAVYDQSTASTMNNFYQNISHPQVKGNKAKALRQAQLSLIESPQFKHPYYWSPFIMIGNWL